MAKSHGYLQEVKYDMEVLIKSIRSPVESLTVSRKSMATAVHQILTVKTTIKLCDNLENLTENK